MSKSAYIVNKILDATLRHTTTGGGFPTADAYVSLHTADPGTTGANEVTGGTYARQQAAFDAAGSGISLNSAIITFTLMPACTVAYFGIWDALAAGNFLWRGVVTVSQAVTVGNTVTIAAGALSVSDT